jgi:hypothetical protein
VHHPNVHAKDRGRATTHRTDVNELTFAAKASTGATRRLDHPKTHDGTTEWIPPQHLVHGQPRTIGYHHPEKLLMDEDDDDDAA